MDNAGDFLVANSCIYIRNTLLYPQVVNNKTRWKARSSPCSALYISELKFHVGKSKNLPVERSSSHVRCNFDLLCCFVVWFSQTTIINSMLKFPLLREIRKKAKEKLSIYRGCEHVSCNNAKTTQLKHFYYLNCRHKSSNQFICIQYRASSSAHTHNIQWVRVYCEIFKVP